MFSAPPSAGSQVFTTTLDGSADVSAFKAALAAAIQSISTTNQLDIGRTLLVSNIEILGISGGSAGGGQRQISGDFVGLSDAQANALIALLQTYDPAIGALVNQQLQTTSPGSALVADPTTHLYFSTAGFCVVVVLPCFSDFVLFSFPFHLLLTFSFFHRRFIGHFPLPLRFRRSFFLREQL